MTLSACWSCYVRILQLSCMAWLSSGCQHGCDYSPLSDLPAPYTWGAGTEIWQEVPQITSFAGVRVLCCALLCWIRTLLARANCAEVRSPLEVGMIVDINFSFKSRIGWLGFPDQACGMPGQLCGGAFGVQKFQFGPLGSAPAHEFWPLSSFLNGKCFLCVCVAGGRRKTKPNRSRSEFEQWTGASGVLTEAKPGSPVRAVSLSNEHGLASARAVPHPTTHLAAWHYNSSMLPLVLLIARPGMLKPSGNI